MLFKGQLFSAPMNWDDFHEQLKELEAHEPHISLPVQGAVLAARVRITIASGLVDLERLLRQATVGATSWCSSSVCAETQGTPTTPAWTCREC